MRRLSWQGTSNWRYHLHTLAGSESNIDARGRPTWEETGRRPHTRNVSRLEVPVTAKILFDRSSTPNRRHPKCARVSEFLVAAVQLCSDVHFESLADTPSRKRAGTEPRESNSRGGGELQNRPTTLRAPALIALLLGASALVHAQLDTAGRAAVQAAFAKTQAGATDQSLVLYDQHGRVLRT